MKVLVVCPIDISAKMLLAAQIRALECAGYTVHVACANGPYVASLIQAGFNMKPIEMVRRVSPIANLKSLLELYRLMRQEQYDIVHVHTFSAAVIGRIAARLAQVPLIFYTFRGFVFHQHSSWLTKGLNIFLERFCGKSTDFFFSQSKENRQLAIEYKIINSKQSLIIGNGVPIDEFMDNPVCSAEVVCSVRKELGISSSATVIGMVSRLVEEKGVMEFFEAAVKVSQLYPQAVFLVVGDTLSSDRTGIARQLREIVEQNGLNSKFFFPGFRSDVARFYKAMDIFVLPSYREGMPRSILEAMASSKPVVATDIPGCREEVVHGETGFLVPVRDSEALSQALLKLLRNPELARRMGQVGQQRAIEFFDERFVCERIVAAYQKIIHQKHK